VRNTTDLGGYSSLRYRIGEISYSRVTRRWSGYADIVPGEPDYAYRWWFEIKTNCDKTDDPQTHPCRHWITNTDDDRLTPDFALDYTASGIECQTDTVCFVAEQEALSPNNTCSRLGRFIDYVSVLPKLLVGIPSQMVMTIAGLTDGTGADLSGEYILNNKYYIAADGDIADVCLVEDSGCPYNRDGVKFEVYDCPVNYEAGYYFLPLGTTWCTLANPNKIGFILVSESIIQFRYLVPEMVAGVPTGCVFQQQHLYFRESPTGGFDFWGDGNTFRRWSEQPATVVSGGTTLLYNFPDTIDVRFEAWER
jgi:hypothetical protein